MKNQRKIINKEVIIKTTLSMIDKNKGIKNVTLRDIAKEIGCAHTNLYNYFGSLDDIYWEALKEVLINMMEYSINGVNESIEPEEKIFMLLSNLIDFSMDNIGWYKFIWFETLGGEPSKEVVEVLHKPGIIFPKIIVEYNVKISQEKAILIGEILQNYLHGEISKWINDRSFINDKEEVKAKILLNLRYLYKLIIKEKN